MKNIILEKFTRWLGTPRPTTEVQIDPLQPDTPEFDATLPAPLRQTLLESLQALSSPPSHQEVVRSGLADALQRWYKNPDAPNCLVVLGSPIEPLSLLLREVLLQWQHPSLHAVPLQSQWATRPHQYDTIKRELAQEIKQSFQQSSPTADRSAEPPTYAYQSVMVVPCLDWCFLRSEDGLEAIEYVRDTILSNHEQFWLLGCNHWAWKYLDYVCQLGAYFGQTLTLPPLDALELRNWLHPIGTALGLEVVEAASPEKPSPTGSVTPSSNKSKEDDLKPWNSRSERKYFESLAETAAGNSRVAAQVWLRSLKLQSQELANDAESSDIPQMNEEKQADDRPIKPIQRDKPKLPNLPTLNATERYILFSLLLHGGLSLTHLATSLGEAEGKVRADVQVLKRANLIEPQPQLLRVNPLYYLSVKADLKRNNFLVGDDS